MKQYFSKKAIVLAVAIAMVGVSTATVSAQEGNTTLNVSQNTVVVVPTPAASEPADAVLFYITDDRQTAGPGDEVIFRVVVRNQRNDDINEIKITARIPDFLIPLATSPEGEANPGQRTIIWNDVNLSARAEQTYAIRAQIAPNAPAGQIIRTVAEINGPGVRGSFTDSTEVEGEPAFQVAEQAAVTVAPAAPAVSQQPVSVAPTARTGPVSTLAFMLLTALSGVGLFTGSRLR